MTLMEKKTYALRTPKDRGAASYFILSGAPDGWIVTVSEPTRSLAQNSLMWDLLTALSEQVEWHGVKLAKEEWKDAITAALKGQKVIPGLTGTGFVVIGAHTSKMTIAEMNDVIEFCYAFGSEKSVKWKSNREE
jgi:hypothetical protein